MGLKKICSIFIVTALTSTASVAQDFIVRQAPIDKHMRKIDTLALKSVIEREEAQSPSSKLYEDWDNKYTHKATELPDSFRINLRGFHMPTESRVVTSNFGARWGRQHKGLDIKVYIGDTIRAAFSGKVRIVKYDGGGYGKYVVIRHNNGLETIYGHMSAQLVEENQVVKAGQPIGLGGNTGRSTGSHLHFETRLCGVALNPALLFDFKNQDVTADNYMFRRDTYDRESLAATRLRGKNDDVASATSKEPAVGDNVEVGEVRYHKVARGETLYSIAQKRGTTVDKICRLNHISKKQRVRPGQILRYS